MANPLTGDFEAVFQVSGGTLNRLLGSMHQNAFANPKLPSFPHTAFLRIGDGGQAVDGVRGSLQAQLSVPRVELTDGSQDRFVLEVGVRARFTVDPGSTGSLPEFINGTVRAEYEIADLSQCPGWERSAADYLWIRVVEDSVSFTSTSTGPVSGLLARVTSGGAQQRSDEAIARQVAALLKAQFRATPHPLRGQFQQRMLRSLVAGGRSAAVAPLALSSTTPTGDMASVNEILLEEHDFAVAVSREYILAAMQPDLDQVSGLQLVAFHYQLDLGLGGGAEVDYVANLDEATVEWIGGSDLGIIQFPGAVMSLRVRGSGHATRIYTSGVANISPPGIHELDVSFELVQFLLLTLDVPSERLILAPMGGPSVDVQYDGPFSIQVRARVGAFALNAFPGFLTGALDQGQPILDGLTDRKKNLSDQLLTLDDKATARLEEGAGTVDGLVLRGSIGVAPQGPPAVTFAKSPLDGYDALQAWLPGGRIDEFDWTWDWNTTPLGRYINPAMDWDGAATLADRFVLRPADARGSGQAALPGIDDVPQGMVGGRVCLKVKGRRVDPRTGEWVSVETGSRCVDLYPRIGRLADSRLLWVMHRYAGQRSGDSPREVGLLDVGGGSNAKAASNTLLVYLDAGWDRDAASALREGLTMSRRDAGVLVLVLFPEGLPEEQGPDLGAELRELAGSLATTLVVNEDVRRGWSAAYGLPVGTGEIAWRLISPGGGVSWIHQGPVSPRDLASALDGCLFASPPPQVESRRSVEVGRAVTGVPFDLGARASGCPPPPWFTDRIDLEATVTAFVQAGSSSSEQRLQQLDRISREREEGAAHVAAILDGAGADEAEAMKTKLGLNFDVLPDPSGAIAEQFGVQIWPTTLTVSHEGFVAGVEIGLDRQEPGERGEG